jgi:transcriptional regulator with XRE-family HTH domain
MDYRKMTDPAEIIRQRRTDLALTQVQLAKMMGYTNANFLTIIEKKKSAVPIERALDFATHLEMDQRWFLERVMREKYPQLAEFIFSGR